MDEQPGPRRDLHEQNRLSWNEATKAHNSHKGDQAQFFREGGDKLYPEERRLLGDLRGRRVVHLQCNAGQDTLSLAQLGAHVTGVDISDEAIAFARQLSADSGIPATFVRADVYDWLAETAAASGRWDIAFSSYGALPWLSDLRTWAKGIHDILVPGGRFVLVEFHPVLYMFETDWSLRYDYFHRGPRKWDDGVQDYVAVSGDSLALTEFHEGVVGFRNPHPSWEFQWTTSDVITALIEGGMVLETFEEYPYINGWKGWERMRDGEGRRAYPPGDVPAIPLMFSVSARRPG